MFRKLLSLPTSFFESNASGVVVSRFTFDATQVALGTSSVATVIIKDGLSIAALMGYLLYLNWKLTLLTFVIAPPIMFVVGTVSRRLRAMSQGAQQAMGDLNQVLNETTAGIKVVKVFGGQAYEDGAVRRAGGEGAPLQHEARNGGRGELAPGAGGGLDRGGGHRLPGGAAVRRGPDDGGWLRVVPGRGDAADRAAEARSPP